MPYTNDAYNFNLMLIQFVILFVFPKLVLILLRGDYNLLRLNRYIMFALGRKYI